MCCDLHREQLELTRIGHLTDERAARDWLSVELDVDGVRLGLLRREVHQTATASENLDVVGHFSVVDRYLQLPLACLRRVHPELAGLPDHTISQVGYTDQRRVIDLQIGKLNNFLQVTDHAPCLKEHGRLSGLPPRCVHVENVGADLVWPKNYLVQSVMLLQPA